MFERLQSLTLRGHPYSSSGSIVLKEAEEARGNRQETDWRLSRVTDAQFTADFRLSFVEESAKQVERSQCRGGHD